MLKTRWIGRGLGRAVLVTIALAGATVAVAGSPAQAAITPDVAIAIKAGHSNLCLNIQGAKTADDTPVVQYNCSDAFTNDKFRIVPKGTGTFQIVANFSGKCLNVYRGNDANNTPVHQYGCSDTATNNLWRFVPVATKTTFRIVSADSGKCLNVYNNGTAINTAVNIYGCSTSATALNDQFYFPPAAAAALNPAVPTTVNTPVVAVQGGKGTAALGPLVYGYVNDNGQLRRGYQANPEIFTDVTWETVSSLDLFAGHPAVNVQADGRVQFAAQHSDDGDLWLSTQNAQADGAFGGWQDVGGSGMAQPVTGKLPNGKLVAFALVGGKLWHLPQDGTNVPYGLWRYIGGTDLVGEPAVVVTATGLRVFALDSAGALRVADYNDGRLGDFTSLGGTGLTGNPAVLVRPGYVDRVVMRTTDGSVVTKLQRTDGTFEPDWTTIPGVAAAGTPAVVLDPQTGRTSIVVRATDNTVWFTNETGQATGQFNSWIQPTDTPIVTDPTIVTYNMTGRQTWAYVTRNANFQLFVVTTNSNGTPEGLVAGRKAAAPTPKFTEHRLPKPPVG